MVVLDRLLEPCVVEFFQHAAHPHGPSDRVPVVCVEAQHEVVTQGLSYGPGLGDVTGDVDVLAGSVAVPSNLDCRWLLFFNASLYDIDHLSDCAVRVPAN